MCAFTPVARCALGNITIRNYFEPISIIKPITVIKTKSIFDSFLLSASDVPHSGNSKIVLNAKCILFVYV